MATNYAMFDDLPGIYYVPDPVADQPQQQYPQATQDVPAPVVDQPPQTDFFAGLAQSGLNADFANSQDWLLCGQVAFDPPQEEMPTGQHSASAELNAPEFDEELFSMLFDENTRQLAGNMEDLVPLLPPTFPPPSAPSFPLGPSPQATLTPKADPAWDNVPLAGNPQPEGEPVVRRGRGRPRKHPARAPNAPPPKRGRKPGSKDSYKRLEKGKKKTLSKEERKAAVQLRKGVRAEMERDGFTY